MEESCSICLESLRLQIDSSTLCLVTITTCRHVFHTSCISKHLENKRTCPNCRAACTNSNLIGIPNNILTITKYVQEPVIEFIGANTNNQSLLHRDLEARNMQIQELQMDASQDEEEIEYLTSELTNVRNALNLKDAEINRLKSDFETRQSDLVTHKLVLEESVRKLTLNVNESNRKYKDLEKECLLKYKGLENEYLHMERRLKAYQMVDGIDIELPKVHEEWISGFETITMQNSKEDIYIFVKKIYFKLKESIDELHVFKSRAFKLNSEKKILVKEIDSLRVSGFNV